MGIKKLVRKLKKENPEFLRAYKEQNLGFEVGNEVLNARLSAGLSQAELASRVGTQQPSIARVEAGTTLPSLSFLERIAAALDTKLNPPQFQVNIDNAQGTTTQSTSIESPFSFEEVTTLKYETNNDTENQK